MVNHLFIDPDPNSPAGRPIHGGEFFPDDAPIPEIGAKKREYDMEWEVTRIEREGEDTVVYWAPLAPRA
jgi:hypothetical protein